MENDNNGYALNETETGAASCCCEKPQEQTYQRSENLHWIIGAINTCAGYIPKVSTVLLLDDKIGVVKTRLGIGRMQYSLAPGLYAVGSPGTKSPVLVSANYKLSFDVLRSNLSGRDAWILVLDTKGINVWCAAGKGTFGTEEIVRRIESTRLSEIVAHKTIIVPQLGAPGVSAQEVQRGSGFRVKYGPVRAGDINAYIDAGMKATAEMRRVNFTFRDRIVLIPVEFMIGMKLAFIAAVIFLILSGLSRGGYSIGRVAGIGGIAAALIFISFLSGVALTPALLPWLPGRAFSVKGALAGIAIAAAVEVYAFAHPAILGSWLSAAAWLLVIPAISSFAAMNFTGASTYTSLSGVKKEMNIAMPAQAISAGAGLILWIAGRFV
ncbi:MAG: mercury methylation corrinoid protein HgcA [bacterium]